MPQDKKLLFRFVFNTLFNKYGKIIFCLLILFYTISLLFSYYIFEYKDKFIDKLQAIYPYTYVYSKGDIKPLKDTTLHKEIFEISFSELEFSYTNDTKKQSFTNIGLRSFHEKNIPLGIMDKYDPKKKNTIFISGNLYDKIISHEKYKDKLYINYSDSDVTLLVSIEPIILFDVNDWIIIPNHIGKKLFKKAYFDKNVIIAKDLEKAYNDYKTLYPNTYKWDDSLSFFGIVFYKLINYFFLIYKYLFGTLIVLFIIVTLKGILNEFKKMTMFASRFGLSLQQLNLIYTSTLITYFLSIITISYLSASFLIQYLNRIYSFNSSLSIPSVDIFGIIVLISLFSSLFVYYYGIKQKRTKYV